MRWKSFGKIHWKLWNLFLGSFI